MALHHYYHHHHHTYHTIVGFSLIYTVLLLLLLLLLLPGARAVGSSSITAREGILLRLLLPSRGSSHVRIPI